MQAGGNIDGSASVGVYKFRDETMCLADVGVRVGSVVDSEGDSVLAAM